MIIGAHYEVAFTPLYGPQNDTNREYEDFRKFETAVKRAAELVKQGCNGVLVDRFNSNDDLIASYSVDADGNYKQVV